MIERTCRLPLPDGMTSPAGLARAYQPAFVAALGELQAAAMRLDSMDSVTTEIVRLRCASHHDCHT